MMFIAFIAAAATVPKATAIDPASWFSSDNYPIEAIKQGVEGSVTFDVDVDPEGKPVACQVTVSSGHPILDQTTCDVVQRQGRFIPPIGPDGKPVAGHYSNRAVWRLPDMVQPGYRATIVDFTADPLHPSCTVESKGPQIGGTTCEQWEEQAVSAGLGHNLTKLVLLISMASGSDVPFPGRPEWGTRVSHRVTDAYYMHGGFPSACVEVAAEGIVTLRNGGCDGFPGTHAPTEEDKAKAVRTRIEQSVFALARAAVPTQQPSLPEASAPVIEYPSVAAALKGLRSRRDVVFRTENGWLVATDEAHYTIWSFSPPSYPAYPAVVKRQVVPEGSGSAIKTSVQCEASKVACDDLVRTFASMTGGGLPN